MTITYWKICKQCGEYFDIGINFEECPTCRLNLIEQRIRKYEKERERDGNI